MRLRKVRFFLLDISLWNLCLSSEWTMAIDSNSQYQSDGDGGRLWSSLLASTQHFSGNLRSCRHDLAVTPALEVADAALARHLRHGLRAGVRKRLHSERGCVTVLGWLCVWGGGNFAGLPSRCLAECALNCRCRQNQGTSRYEPGYARDTCRTVLVYIQIRTKIRADTDWDTCRYELGYVQKRTGIRADTNWDTCRYKQYMSRYGQKYVSQYGQ